MFQQLMDRDKYSFLFCSCLSKIPHEKQENPRITENFEPTVLLLKKIYLLPHCYALKERETREKVFLERL